MYLKQIREEKRRERRKERKGTTYGICSTSLLTIVGKLFCGGLHSARMTFPLAIADAKIGIVWNQGRSEFGRWNNWRQLRFFASEPAYKNAGVLINLSSLSSVVLFVSISTLLFLSESKPIHLYHHQHTPWICLSEKMYKLASQSIELIPFLPATTSERILLFST